MLQGLINAAALQEEGFLHRLHPLSKLLLALFIFVYALAVNSPLFQTSLLAVILSFLIISRQLVILARALPPALIIGTIMFFISSSLGSTINDSSVFALRILIMFTVFIFFAATTDPSTYLRSLQALKLPSSLCLALLIAFRFIPLLIDEMQKINLSFSLRKSAGRTRTRNYYRGIMVPFIFRLFTLADDLTLALYVRGYGCIDKPTIFRPVSWKVRDLLFLTTGVIFVLTLHLATSQY